MNVRECGISLIVIVISVTSVSCNEIDHTTEFQRSNNTNLRTELKNVSAASGQNKEIPSSRGVEKKWIKQIFSEGEQNFRMDVAVSEACQRDFQLYKNHLRNHSEWAIRMLDSSEWPSTGLFTGTQFHVGNWHECLMTSYRHINGQYCFISANYTRRNISTRDDTSAEINSAWNIMELYEKLPWKESRLSLNWALCLPASCPPTDVENSINQTLYPIFNEQDMVVSIKVHPGYCATRKRELFSAGFYTVSAFLSVIFGLVILSSTLDFLADTKGKSICGKSENFWREALEAFSVLRNFKKLITVTSAHSPAVYLMKIVFMIFIMQAHRLMYEVSYPISDPEITEMRMYSSNNVNLSIRGLYFVDVFFVISGFLTFHLGFCQSHTNGMAYLISSIVFRWSRMVLTFVPVMLFIIHVLPYLNEGPFWNYYIGTEAENCKSTFWNNIFLLSNLVNTDKMCLFISWYISTDIQLTILSSILLLIICKYEKLGICLTISVFILGNLTTIVITYVNELHAMMPLYMTLHEYLRNTKEFHYYVSSYSRMGPYFLGFLAAIVTRKLKQMKYVFSKGLILFFTAFDIVSKCAIFFYAAYLMEFVKKYNRLENAIDAAILRLLFVLPEAIILCEYFTSGFDVFQKYVDSKIWVPLGRLLYCVFLVHTLLQLIHSASSYVLMPPFSYLTHFWFFGADVLYSFVAGFLLHLFLEAPVVAISKLLLRKNF